MQSRLPTKIPPCAINMLARPAWFHDPAVIQRARLRPANWLARFLSSERFAGRKDIAAITIGHTIYFRDERQYDPHTAEGLGLLGHEVKHIEQFERHGLLSFYWQYLRDYRQYGGYGEQIPFEQEGYAVGAAIRVQLLTEQAQNSCHWCSELQPPHTPQPAYHKTPVT
jgi:hypothetical protein